MQNYKAPDNSLHCIEPEFAHLLPAGCVEITEAEADELRPKPDPIAALNAMSISPRQIRQALTRVGLRAQVEQAIAAADQDTKDWYEFATEFVRGNPHVVAMGQALGQTPAQLDALWELGATL